MRKSTKCLIIFLIILLAGTYIYADQGPGQNQEGYLEISRDYLSSISSEVISYDHIKSGARIVQIKNNDPNKAFAIGFKTPIYDNSGVNHIIEHTVFTGSKKYNSQDVFFEMKKRSPSLFMNASTAADMTIYPFSTRNHKDFNNLLDVYLDAVFSPNLQRHPYGFNQEGGVVYNEMRGASVAPRRILAMANRTAMFPDTMYIYNAGGSPEEIPKLTYDQFKETHKKYYVPSNSCVYIYGDVDLGQVFEKLDSYYKHFTKEEGQNISQKQTPFKEQTYYAGLYPATSHHENCYMSTNFAVGEIEDVKLQLSMRILMDLLTQYDKSPLRQAFRQKQASKTLSYDVDGGIPQPMYSIVATNVMKDDIQELELLINETLEKTLEEGFNRELIRMAINNYEIKIKQSTGDISKGVDMAYTTLYSWGHGVEPAKILEEQKLIKDLKKEGNSRYFQALLKTHLIDNTHRSQVVLEPDENYIADRQEEAKSHIKGQEEQPKWEEEANQTSQLPQISLNDINRFSPLPKLKIRENKKEKTMYYLGHTNDLVYIDLYFDTAYIPQESLNELFLFAHLLGQKEKNLAALYTGGIQCEPIAIPRFEWYNEYDPKLKISVCSEKDNISNTFKILERIGQDNTWDPQWLLSQIHKIRGQYEAFFSSNPLDLMTISMGKTQEGASRYDYEKIRPFYQYICQIEDHYDLYKDQIISKLEVINQSVFNKDTIILGASLDKKNIRVLDQHYKKYKKKLKKETYPKNQYIFESSQKRNGFPIASDVQYIVWGGNYKEKGGLYNGSLYVLANILNSDYLLKNMRVKNGAYGAGIKFNPYGAMTIYTYQDPQLLQSLNIIEDLPSYIEGLELDPKTLDDYKIGAFSRFEEELGLNSHPKIIGSTLQQYYLSGLTGDRLEKVKDEIFSTSLKDIKDQARMLEGLIEDRRYSVAGTREKLLTTKAYFDIIQSFQ